MTAAESSPTKKITTIGLSEKPDSINVKINGTAPLTYTSVKQPLPMGVVLYFPHTRLSAASQDVQSTVAPVTAIHASQVKSGNDTVRVEILLAKDVPYNVVQDGNALDIQFAKSGPTSSKGGSAPAAQSKSVASPAPVKASQPDQPAPAPVVKSPETFQGTGAPVAKEKKIWVNRIDFLGGRNGRSTLSIETTAKVHYQLKKVTDKRLELRLMNANIARFRQRPLITTRFNSAVNRITPIQLPSMKNYSVFSIELRQAVPYHIEQLGGLLLVHFAASSVPPTPVNEANLPAWKKALESAVGPAEMLTPPAEGQNSSGKIESVAKKPAETAASAPSQSEAAETSYGSDQPAVIRQRPKKYTGQKISLDFYQTDIKNVFRILQSVSGKNFAIDKDVTGTVTLTLDNPVPWDQVLDLVLKMNQLGEIVDGNIIRIATLKTLATENALRKARIAAAEKEKEQMRSLEPLETRYIPISYSNAKTEILPHIKDILTKGRGSVSVDTRNNQIIITDTAQKIAQAEQIARKIDKVTSEVIIEARVVEVKQSYSKELGFDWSLGVGPITLNKGGSQYTTSVAMNFPASNTSATNSLGLTYNKIAGTPFTLDAALTALQSNGNGKILSAPKIVTLNNKKAMIKQGEEIGYLERDSSGGSSVKFKDVDLLLEVTPHVTPDNRISLNIKLTKNDVSGYVDGVPTIGTNEADTQLLVNNGDTIVIGGIIKSQETKKKQAFPGLYKIPVLGWMFQDNYQDLENNELLIFMNPKIVQLAQRKVSD